MQSAVHCTNASEPDADGNPSKQLFDCFNPQKCERGTFFTQSESLNLKSCVNLSVVSEIINDMHLEVGYTEHTHNKEIVLR